MSQNKEEEEEEENDELLKVKNVHKNKAGSKNILTVTKNRMKKIRN